MPKTVEKEVKVVETKPLPLPPRKSRSVFGICFGCAMTTLVLVSIAASVFLLYQYLLFSNSSTNLWKIHVRTPLKSKTGTLVDVPVSLAWVGPVFDQIFNKWLPQIITPKHHKTYVAPYLPNVAELQNVSAGRLKITLQAVPYVSLVIMLCYIVFTRFAVLFFQTIRGNGRANNIAPRTQQAKMLEEGGIGARAIGSHENAIEAFLYFSVALFAALQTANLDLVYVAELCIIIVLSRFVYHWLYILDIFTGLTRTFVWYIGFVGNLFLLFIPIQHYKVFQ